LNPSEKQRNGNLERAMIVRAEKEQERRNVRDEQLRDVNARFPGLSIAKYLVILKREYPAERWNVSAVNESKKRTGISTHGAGQFKPKNEATGTSAPEPDAPEAWKALLEWNVLTLFDKLAAQFDVIEDGDEVISEHDKRATWIAWRVFLAAVFALPCPTEFDDCPYPGVPDSDVQRGAANVKQGASNQEIYTACTGRADWPALAAKIVALIVGRRGGKSYITAIVGIYLACCRRYVLKLGTKAMVMILARDREQAGVIRGYIKAFLHAIDETREMIANETDQRIELKNGVTIEVRAVSDSGAGTRGYTVVAALMDEIAFWPTDATSKKQDKAVLRALRPSMAFVRWRTAYEHGTGALIVMLSSPYAKRGVLFDTWLSAYGQKQDANSKRPILAWQADTLTMRPEQDPDLLADIEAEYEDDPENAKAEYGGHWRSDLETIFSKEAINGVCVEGVYERPYVASNAPYRAFVDPSGGSSDSYTIAIAHDEEIAQDGETFRKSILDKVIEWIPKFDPQGVSIEVAQLCKDYRISTVTGDAYGGEWPRDPLKKQGIGYTVSEKTRSELYLDFLPVVNSGRCALLDTNGNKHVKRGVNQFVNLERRTGRTGKDAVDHPQGSHDDVSNAIAGVMVSGAAMQYRIRRPSVTTRAARHGESVGYLR
jgi:hypothetical protein